MLRPGSFKREIAEDGTRSDQTRLRGPQWRIDLASTDAVVAGCGLARRTVSPRAHRALLAARITPANEW